MGLFRKAEEKKVKISREELALTTHIQLEQLRDKYEAMLAIQRRILKGEATKHEKERAREKIRSGLCSYMIVNEAIRHLDEITSDVELTNSLKDMNRSLRAVNKLGRKASPGPVTKFSLNRQVHKIDKREDQVQPGKVFNDQTLGTVDEWLSSRWDSVAGSYIEGEDLGSLVRSSRELLESEPPLTFDDALEDQGEGPGGSSTEYDVSDELKALLNSNIF